ncbi:MAG: ABC transporter permease, partial [Endomicrobium sp.]|nr:ABC transporter permease [Endomicrobium sp.]
MTKYVKKNKTKLVKACRFIERFGQRSIGIAVESLEGAGKAVVMTTETIAYILKGDIPLKSTVVQMVEVGWCSTPIIMLTSFFTGMVLALQVGTATANLFNEPVYVGTVTGFSLVIELGPVLTAIVVTGRVGAAIT